MARIEGETGNAGGVREWLARAVNAPRDPAWTADGFVSDDWAAVSPVTGALDAFRWRVPVEATEPSSKDLLAQKIEELVKVGVRPENVIAASVAGGPMPAQPTQPGQPGAAEADAISQSNASVQAVKQVRIKPAQAEDAEVVEVVTVVSAAAPAAVMAAAPAMKVIDLPPRVEDKPTTAAVPAAATAKPVVAEAAKPAAAVKSFNGNGRTKGEGAAGDVRPPGDGPAKVMERTAAGPVRTAPAEPKIFISPRAPDDPGPISDRKK